MTNLHTPERQRGESFEAYRARRAASKDAVQRMTLTGKYHPRNGVHKSIALTQMTAWDPKRSRVKANRRADIKAAGGIRQFKKLDRFYANHPDA